MIAIPTYEILAPALGLCFVSFSCQTIAMYCNLIWSSFWRRKCSELWSPNIFFVFMESSYFWKNMNCWGNQLAFAHFSKSFLSIKMRKVCRLESFILAKLKKNGVSAISGWHLTVCFFIGNMQHCIQINLLIVGRS